MRTIANALLVLIAVIHSGFVVLEMLFWDHPIGRTIFAMTPEVSASSAVLAMNQGLYNGFLVTGLVWGLVSQRRDVKIFFLACVLVAGVFGGITAKPSIFLIQGLPALLALACIVLDRQLRPLRGA